MKGQHVLPGVAYLEMARAAVESAVDTGVREDLAAGRTGIRLSNVVWTRPIVVDEEAVQVHIGLFPDEAGKITYEIYSEPAGSAAEPVLHSQGNAALNELTEAVTLDLASIQAQCTHSTLTSSQCYEAYKASGIEYGPAHRGVDVVYVGQSQALAKLSLPAQSPILRTNIFCIPAYWTQLYKHLSVYLGVGENDRGSLKPLLPFALQEVEILGKMFRCDVGLDSL